MLPPFEVVRRQRPVALLAPHGLAVDVEDARVVDEPARARAPYLTVVAHLPPRSGGPVELGWTGAGLALTASYDGERLGLEVTQDGRTTRHASRRHARVGAATALAVTLTGRQVTAYSRDRDAPPGPAESAWVARARVDLDATDVHDPAVLASLRVRTHGRAERVRAGRFGWLGLRDLHVATEVDGEPVRDAGGRLLLSATHAGPGPFATAHGGLWWLDPATSDLEHLADLFTRRTGSGRDRPGVYGDHATHLVRDGGRWRVLTSTWGDVDSGSPDADVRIVHGVTATDLTARIASAGGVHVLDVDLLPVPLEAAGVWDPHLLRRDGEWWLAFVAARRFFDFRPALARGATLDALRLVASDDSRTETEGTVMVRLDGRWRVLASDGRDNPRGRRAAYGVYDLGLRRIGGLEAPYLTNIPWPMVVEDDDGWLMVTFDGSPYGDPRRRGVLGYGTHGDVVVMRARRAR